MAPPLYFLPHVKESEFVAEGRLSRAHLLTHGLEKILSDVRQPHDELCLANLQKGPSGEPGLLIVALPTSGRGDCCTSYVPGRQDWQAVPGQESWLWLGLDRFEPPRPACLKRRQRHAGYPVELADGHSYEAPILRRPDGSTLLPRDPLWDRDGKFDLRLRPEYVDLWDRARDLCDLFFPGSAGPPTLDEEFVYAFAVDALNLNYRYDRHLQTRRPLVTTTNWVEICQAAVDVPLLRSLLETPGQKKSDGTTRD